MIKTMNCVLELWEEYDRVVAEYSNKSVPELIEYPPYPQSREIDEYKIYRNKVRDISKQNDNISRIRYIIQNNEKIEAVIEYLDITFKISKSQIRQNISFYDRIFQLSLDKVREKVTNYIELFGSKELFLEAMFTGTPLQEITRCRGFCGIMNYKNIGEKLTAFANELELSRLDASKIFVYHSTYMYCSPQTLSKSLEYLCNDLSVSKKELGPILMKCPSLIYNANRSVRSSEIKVAINRLNEVFFLSKDEALKVLRYYPQIAKCFWQSICELAEENDENVPEILRKKHWLNNIYDIAQYYNGYDYGTYNEVLYYFEHLEKHFGKIVNVYFRNMQPLTKELKQGSDEVLYTVILIQRKDNPGSYLFVSFGFGYKTKNNAENRLLSSIFKVKFFTELLNVAPTPETSEYHTMLDNIFQMCATGDGGDGCSYDLDNGNSLVIDELNDDKLSQVDTNGFVKGIIDFKTMRVIPTKEIKTHKE